MNHTADPAPPTDGSPRTSGSGPLLLIFAHPDDESFGCAGTLALAAEQGVRATLVCATRGEAGEFPESSGATRDTIGVVREAELRTAMAVVGLADIRFLAYRDSGMAGTPDNDDPRALVQATEAVVAARLATIIRDLRPETVITFGPDGIYGHPDHLYIHRVAVRAVHDAAEPAATTINGDPWATPALSFTAVPRSRMQAMATRTDGPLRGMSPDEIDRLGTPDHEITTRIDVARVGDKKEAAIRAHRTQVGEGGPMAGMPREQVNEFLSREHFVRVPLPWDDPLRVHADFLASLAIDAVGAPV